MILYIIYIEPFLIYLERKAVGLKIEHFSQCVEAFCDDVNILTDQISDFFMWLIQLSESLRLLVERYCPGTKSVK